MHRTSQARTQLGPRSIPEVLSASYQAFEQILATIREHEEHSGGLFAAFVLGAASAADGRDALMAAPSLQLPAAPARPTVRSGGTTDQTSDSPRLAGIADIANALADLSKLVASTLARAASQAVDPVDQDACAEAARCAQAMWFLLAGPGP